MFKRSFSLARAIFSLEDTPDGSTIVKVKAKGEAGVSELSSPSVRQERLFLKRLECLTDVVFAILIWQIFMLIPTPDSIGKTWPSLFEYAAENGVLVLVVLVGVGWVIVYWIQSNILFSALKATDKFHSAVSITQLFLLFVFLYSMKLGVDIGGSAGTWAFESISSTAIGLCAYLAFEHARRSRLLLHEDVSDEAAAKMSAWAKAAPISTGVTIPFAFIPGPVLLGFSVTWESSFFIYPIVVAIIKRFSRTTAI